MKMNDKVLQASRERSAFRVSAQRLVTVGVILGTVWLVEVTLTSGPFAQMLPNPMPAILSIMLFVIAFSAGVGLIVSYKPLVPRSLPRTYGAGIARIAIIIAILLAFLAVATGATGYDPVFGEQRQETSLLGSAWAPASLGSVAARLAMPNRFTLFDWALVASITAVSLVPGGRTIPALIIIMVALRTVLLPDASGTMWTAKSRNLILLIIAGVASILFFVAFAAERALASGATAFSAENLEYYGYNFGPPLIQYVHATIGVIGEAARLVQVTSPAHLPYPGFGLFFQDLFSFLPGHQPTVTDETRSVYLAAGSLVVVSRPGGTVATLFMLNGNAGVIIGGLAYGAILTFLLKRGIEAKRYAESSWFLLLAATFVVGAYGTGTPTTFTLLSAIVAWIVCSASGLSSSSRLSGVSHR